MGACRCLGEGTPSQGSRTCAARGAAAPPAGAAPPRRAGAARRPGAARSPRAARTPRPRPCRRGPGEQAQGLCGAAARGAAAARTGPEAGAGRFALGEAPGARVHTSASRARLQPPPSAQHSPNPLGLQQPPDGTRRGGAGCVSGPGRGLRRSLRRQPREAVRRAVLGSGGLEGPAGCGPVTSRLASRAQGRAAHGRRPRSRAACAGAGNAAADGKGARTRCRRAETLLRLSRKLRADCCLLVSDASRARGGCRPGSDPVPGAGLQEGRYLCGDCAVLVVPGTQDAGLPSAQAAQRPQALLVLGQLLPEGVWRKSGGQVRVKAAVCPAGTGCGLRWTESS